MSAAYVPLLRITHKHHPSQTLAISQVSLGQSAKSIPLAAITGLIAGFLIGYLIFASGSRVNLSIFLVVSTSILLLIGAGLCSRGVWFFQQYRLVRA